MRDRRPLLLDLFCCAGGAAMGYYRAGFDVVGVDIAPQPRYPFTFIQADCMTLDPAFIASFDAIHASPPCQRYSAAQRLQKNEHPDLVGPTRKMIEAAGVLYVIENVPGAPLLNPVTLCGSMFEGLRVYRHREFESNIPLVTPEHPPHTERQVKMGRAVTNGEFIQVVGNFSGVAYARQAMGIDWMTRDELRESIPPAYTQFIGEQLRKRLR